MWSAESWTEATQKLNLIQYSELLKKRYHSSHFFSLWPLPTCTFHSKKTLPNITMCVMLFWDTSDVAFSSTIDPPTYTCFCPSGKGRNLIPKVQRRFSFFFFVLNYSPPPPPPCFLFPLTASKTTLHLSFSHGTVWLLPRLCLSPG